MTFPKKIESLFFNWRLDKTLHTTQLEKIRFLFWMNVRFKPHVFDEMKLSRDKLTLWNYNDWLQVEKSPNV